MEQILRVLIIEDSENDYTLIVRELKRANGFQIISEQVFTEATIRQALKDKTWDLIICDYFLQGFDAPRVMVLLEHLGIDLPFVLVSGSVDQEVADVSLRLGAHEYVSKDRLGRLGPVIHRELKLHSAYDETIKAWGRALELRDHETKGHSERVVEMSAKLAARMGISAPEIVHVKRGAYLHDIGKMGIPDAILLKKGKLTDEEWVIMRGHPVLGYEMVRGIQFLKRALDIPLFHHEKWDGTGYPYGYAGDEIPLAARIFAIVDVWDALTNNRPYHEAMAGELALQYIQDQSGKHFDPNVVEAFVEMMNDSQTDK